MSIYMSKKISVPAEVTVRCVSMNCLDGFIAVGGDHGYLRVLRIDSKGSNPSDKNPAASLATANNLTMNQVLEGHRASIVVVSWNEKYKKLTSGDEKGNIIVWILVKSTWCEEMVNTRNTSVVRDVRWTSDGLKICIVYEDGETIVGSVDGNRIWGKNLKGKLTSVEWSPDGRKLLFGMNGSEIHVYDCMGSHIKTLAYQETDSQLASICWYNGSGGFSKKNAYCLAVTFVGGRCQLTKDELGGDVLDLETGFKDLVSCKWNDDGSLIGILGSAVDNKYSLYIFNTMGQMISKLSMPGKVTTCFSWDRGSVRLAVGIDSFLYLANYRLQYKWCHLKDTIVFVHAKLHEPEDLIIFWDIKRDVATVKSEKNLLHIMGSDDFCCLVTQPFEDEADEEGSTAVRSSAFVLTLANSIGTPLDSKVVDMPVKHFSMSGAHVCVASESAFYVWQFKNIKQLSTIEVTGKKKAGIEKLLHVDDVASGVGGENIDWKKADLESDDPISCLCLSTTLLVVGRCSGMLQVYILQNIMLQNKHTLKCKPINIQLNSNSSCLSIIDDQNVLSFYQFDDESKSVASKLSKKDVWSFLWAKDNPASFVLMEKTKMQIFNDFEPEEPVTSSGYLCSFCDLTVTSVLLDDVMTLSRFGGELSSCRDFISVQESKSLKDLRKVVEETGFEAGMKFVESHSHPKLWKLMAHYALEKLDLKSAELCFARAKHLTGIRFVKKLSNLQNDGIRRAEIAMFCSNFDEAESIYLGMDRRDLAMVMRNKIGDYTREVKLLEGGGGWGRGDYGKQDAYNKLADHYADMQQWSRAIQYYREGRNEEKLIGCYFAIEDYESLKQMLDELPDNHSILPEMGRRFTMVGMCQEAVRAYLKCNQVQLAIDSCVQLNHWNVAVELAHAHDKPEVNDMLVKYMKAFVDSNRIFEAVELYRKSNHFLEAAKILFQMAEASSSSKSNPMQAKKLFLLSALLVEKHHEHNKQLIRNKSKKKENEASLALKGLLEEGAAGSLDSKVLTQAWRSVEAYHFLMLAHRQLYKCSYEASMMTALHLKEFDDILDPVDIYSLLALTSYACKAMSVCSESFMKLETMEKLSDEQKRMYEELAVEIFYRNMKDYKVKEVTCSGCQVRIPYTCTVCPHCNMKFLSCIASGRLINSYQAWCCPCCKRCAIEEEILKNLKACPMCHQRF